jgi:thiamine-phosphate pyrophosphorylase
MTLPDPPLLLVTDRHLATRPLTEIVAAAFAAGCRWASLREKDLPADEQIALAAVLRPMARRYGAMLTVHGDADIAAAAQLDGVHLPAGADAAAARARLGRGALIGISVHGAAEAARLDPRQVDYCVAGPAFATASKPGYGPALEERGIAIIARAAPVPVVAIGGLAAHNLAPVLRAGAEGIAVMGGLMRADDPGGEARALLRAVAAARS